MTATSPELTASTVIGFIEANRYPRDFVLNIARGLLPLPQDDVLAVLAFLAGSPDGEIASTARASMSEMPPGAILDFAANENIEPVHLARLMNASSDATVLETLIRNRSVSDAAVIDLARRADPRLQEIIVINQARILRAPEILDALLANPNVSGETRRRALENREEFFDKKARLAQMADLLEPELLEAEDDQIADLLERADQQVETESTMQPLTESERNDPKKAAIWNRIGFMSVAEKVQLAFRGDRTVRMLLVRDRNKLVCSAVMRNPRMSDQEVEAIAGMRNVDDEVLRLLALRRDWISKYNIMVTLCRNPKTPIGVVLPFVNRLTLRDLKGLKDDKGVQQVVREMAKKTYLARTQKTGG